MSEEVVGGSTILIGGDAEGFVAAIGSAIQAADRLEKEVTSKVSRAVQALAGVSLPDIGKLTSADKSAITELGREMARLKDGEIGLLKFNMAAKGVNETLANSLIGNIERLKDAAKQTENIKLFAGFEKSLAAATEFGEVEKRINALTNAMERLTGKEREAAEQALNLARAQEQATKTQASNDAYIAALAKRTNAIGKSFAELQLEEVALLKQEAALKGVSAQAAPYIAKIEAAALATQKMGVSAGQTKQALAQLPEQFTDIFTSLAGGINPLQVLVRVVPTDVEGYLAGVRAARSNSDTLRRLALVWMERLAEFRPHLAGAVWRGTATRLSAVHLQLYCDDSKQAEIFLLDQRVPYDVGSRPGPRGESVGASAGGR